MAEAKVDGREATWRGLLPWTELFRGFQVALDLNKLLLAAAGIVVMAFTWWLLSLIFGATYGQQPTWPANYASQYGGDMAKAWDAFKKERNDWNLMHEAANAGSGPEPLVWEVADIAATQQEFELLVPSSLEENRDNTPVKTPEEFAKRLQKLLAEKPAQVKEADLEARAPLYAKLGKPKPVPGKMATAPWNEDRGPNPYLLATGQAGVPWEAGHFWDWLLRKQMPVLVEPLVKFFQPIVYFFDPRAGGWARFYFLLLTLVTVVIWGIFGGAITRIASVQAARGEKIGMSEALRFTFKRLREYILAPIFPLAFVFALMVLMVIFGFFEMIPLVGDLVAGLFWPGILVLGLIMAVVLVGLVGWPLMSATISAEGTDSWEAVSRSYSYVYQKPWHYVWYALVAIAYGAVLVFFVGFMGSLMVYLGKWGVSNTPGLTAADREPSYLFIYAPRSFEWRALLLQDGRAEGGPVVQDGQIVPKQFEKFSHTNMHAWNYMGAALMWFWLMLVFLLILGFGYSYFWSAGTLIYLLMRRNVDAAEMDEVYLEEDDHEGPYTPAPPPPPHDAVKPAPLTMVEPPGLRPAPAPAPAPVPVPAPGPTAEAPAPPETAPPPPSSAPPDGGTPPV
jgi:hypothetical protein